MLKFVKGPDFPTGGIVVEDQAAIAEAYKTGRGGFRLRARWEKEEGARGVYQIVVTEIPYQVQKAKLIERIAELLEQKKLPLLDDVHDESAEDIRIVLTPKNRTIDANLLMEQMFRQSDLEVRIPLNLNVLDEGQVPGVMSLKQALQAFIDHRREVLERRSNHRLEKIAARLEVLEGYLAVFLNLDKVIKIIRTEDEPKPKLMKAFGLNDNQAEAILNMRLRALRKLEEMEIRGEHADADQGEKGSHQAAGLRQAEIRKADRGSQGDRRQVRRQDQAGQAPHRNRRRRAMSRNLSALAEEAVELASAVEKEPITIVCSEKLWLRALKGHQEASPTRSNIAKATAAVSGFMPRPPTG